MAVVKPRRRAGDINAKAHGRVQPALPVESVANAVIEIVSPLARETGHLPQDPKWQTGLEVEAIEASHVGLKFGGTTQGLHVMGAELGEFVAASGFQPLRKHRYRRQPVLTTHGFLCSRRPMFSG
jgi:hypothetical protein